MQSVIQGKRPGCIADNGKDIGRPGQEQTDHHQQEVRLTFTDSVVSQFTDQATAATGIRNRCTQLGTQGSMKLAQWVSTLIYLAYVIFLAYLFSPGQTGLSETAIIDLMGYVAPLLPALLILAALSAQLSAAIADTGGCGGLVRELTHHRVSERQTYLLLVVVGLLLTWAADIFAIISYASRAFALYYALQCAVAALNSVHGGHVLRDRLFFGGMALLGLAMALTGTAVE